jgi:hypothetical protein
LFVDFANPTIEPEHLESACAGMASVSLPDPMFVPNQIVCLAADRQFLFGEMVQHVVSRQQCWVRPLVLAVALNEAARLEAIGNADWDWYDLRQGSDLLLPQQLFREALDMEVLPLMSLLYQAEDKQNHLPDRSQLARQQVHALVRRVCQANPQLFLT